MNLFGLATSQARSLNPRTIIQTCHKVERFAARLAPRSSQHSISSIPLPRRRRYVRVQGVECKNQGLLSRFQIRPYASSRIVTRWEDLPRDYKDEQGLDFRTTPLSAAEILHIYGKDVDVQAGNRILKILHGRRVAGTVSDPAYSRLLGPKARAYQAALEWLREKVPVDEIHSEGMRAEQELAAMGEELVGDAERPGLYQPNSSQKQGNGNINGAGVFERVRKANEKAWEEREAARKKQEEEIKQVSSGLEAIQNNQVELRRPGHNERLKYYLERAKVLPDRPPDMTILQRLLPSALFCLLVVGGVVMVAQVYVPPLQSARLFPEMPPAAATVNAIIAANCIIFALWHFPPAFRMLEMYFVSIPGYPRAFSMLGNIFSHKSFSHLAINMAGLWFAGTRLHDDVGRANFLAIYIASGMLGSFVSMTWFVARSQFMSSSLGASGAIMGTAAAYFWFNQDEKMKLFGLPPDPASGIPGLALLAALLLLELASAFSRKGGQKFDHGAHFGGAVVGIAAAQILRSKAQERKKIEMERRRNMGVLDRIKEGKF